jgi:putative ABC transport system substrate-binding protein
MMRPRFAARRLALRATGALAAAAAGRVWAQHPHSPSRIGVLSSRRRPEPLAADYYGAFPVRMRELGYTEGRNLAIEWRFAEGDYERLPDLAAELVRGNMNVILALGPPGAVAARKATATIPIVFVMSSDPVAAGLVKSLAKPDGNVTGIFNLAGDLGSKHLEMLAAVVPKLARVGVLVNPANPGYGAALRDVETAASKLRIQVIPARAQTAGEIETAFAAMASARAGAAIVTLDPLFIQEVEAIAEQAARNRLASIFANREFAEAGGLMSYGQNQVEIYRRAAEYVDRILKGAKPAELPVEQPTKLELFLNNRTARRLGLTMPQSLRVMASAVIE